MRSNRKRVLAAAFALSLLLAAAIPGTGGTESGIESASGRSVPYRIIWDDFSKGFSIGQPDSKWFFFAAPPFIGNDGITTTSNKGLRVIPLGTNHATGEPAFTLTLPQEQNNTVPLPGGLDHVKWLVYMNHYSSRGYPGFDAIPGHELRCETWLGGRSYGTDHHPFGSAVQDPDDDLRLGSPAMNTIDFETMMVFDFFLTNKQVYVFYERLPFAREQLGNYASFSFQIPVAERQPEDMHHLVIAYNKEAGYVRWILDDTEVYRVTSLGHLIDRQFMTLDHGGEEQAASPDQLACGMGLFTLLDASLPTGTGLVRLSSSPDFYYDPAVGQPTPAPFADDEGLETNRLFGQGAELRVRRYVVSSRPAD